MPLVWMDGAHTRGNPVCALSIRSGNRDYGGPRPRHYNVVRFLSRRRAAPSRTALRTPAPCAWRQGLTTPGRARSVRFRPNRNRWRWEVPVTVRRRTFNDAPCHVIASVKRYPRAVLSTIPRVPPGTIIGRSHTHPGTQRSAPQSSRTGGIFQARFVVWRLFVCRRSPRTARSCSASRGGPWPLQLADPLPPLAADVHTPRVAVRGPLQLADPLPHPEAPRA